MRNLTEPEAAWVGAMIEAEGHVIRQNKGRPAEGWRIGFTNTDIELISAMLRATNVGRVYFVRNSGQWSTRPVWQWLVMRKEDVLTLAMRVAPYSQKVRKVFGYLHP